MRWMEDSRDLASFETLSRFSSLSSSFPLTVASLDEDSDEALRCVALTSADFSKGVEDGDERPMLPTVLFRFSPAGFGFVGGGGDLARFPLASVGDVGIGGTGGGGDERFPAGGLAGGLAGRRRAGVLALAELLRFSNADATAASPPPPSLVGELGPDPGLGDALTLALLE